MLSYGQMLPGTCIGKSLDHMLGLSNAMQVSLEVLNEDFMLFLNQSYHDLKVGDTKSLK